MRDLNDLDEISMSNLSDESTKRELAMRESPDKMNITSICYLDENPSQFSDQELND